MTVNTIKTFGNLQTTFMWTLSFDTVPVSGTATSSSTDATSGALAPWSMVVRTTSLPKKERAFKNFRYKNRQIAIPMGTEHEGEWKCTVVMTQTSGILQGFINWFYLVDSINVDADYKANASLVLQNLDGSLSNSKYKIIGIYPVNVPSLEGLNQENTDGHVQFDMVFGFDDMIHQINGAQVDVSEVPYPAVTF